jgi:Probable transposase
MLIYEYKLDATQKQYAAIDEAMRIVQFIRNKCLRKWMDEQGVSQNELQGHGSLWDWASALSGHPRYFRKAEKRVKRLHRQLSRKQKNSSNRKKARKVLAKAYLKVQRQREDFALKQANALARSHDLIA